MQVIAVLIFSGLYTEHSWAEFSVPDIGSTCKYPSVVLKGDDTVGEVYSVSSSNNHQQADTGTKTIHKRKTISR